MSYTGTVERTVDDAVELAKADLGSHDVGGFAIIGESDGYSYLPLAPDTTITDTAETKIVGRWKKAGDDWSEMLKERAVGET